MILRREKAHTGIDASERVKGLNGRRWQAAGGAKRTGSRPEPGIPLARPSAGATCTLRTAVEERARVLQGQVQALNSRECETATHSCDKNSRVKR